MSEWDRPRLESLQRAVVLALDAAQIAHDQVSTLLMVTTGGRASGPETRADPRRRLGWLAPRAPGYPMDEQLRRARASIDDLGAELATLRASLTQALVAPAGLGIPAEVERVRGWVTPTIDRAGGKASIPALSTVRTAIAELASDLTAIDGRLRLALIRLP